MYRFILKRLLMLIPVLLGVSFIVYTILSFTPGDPVQMMLGDNYSEESYAAMQEELGLDDPFLVQYGRFIINAVHGDFGTSYSTGNPVAAEIAARLPNTILLSACAMLFAILIGIPLGVISATHQYSAVDNISMVGALFGGSMPNFWLGLMLIVIFAAGLGWFPSSNFETWGRSGAAGRHPQRQLPGDDHPHDPLLHAGGHAAGLCDHRPCQGRFQEGCYLQASAAQFHDPYRHHHGNAPGLHGGLHRPDREPVRHPGPWQRDDEWHQQP